MPTSSRRNCARRSNPTRIKFGSIESSAACSTTLGSISTQRSFASKRGTTKRCAIFFTHSNFAACTSVLKNLNFTALGLHRPAWKSFRLRNSLRKASYVRARRSRSLGTMSGSRSATEAAKRAFCRLTMPCPSLPALSKILTGKRLPMTPKYFSARGSMPASTSKVYTVIPSSLPISSNPALRQGIACRIPSAGI